MLFLILILVALTLLVSWDVLMVEDPSRPEAIPPVIILHPAPAPGLTRIAFKSHA
jgi:hypothetical protein